MRNLKPYALSLLAGGLYALGFPSFIAKSLLITPIIAITILFYIYSNTAKLKSKLLHTLIFGVGFNFVGFYWITKTLVEFGELSWPVASLLSGLFSFLVAPHLWPIVLGIHFIQKKGHFSKERGLPIASSVPIAFLLSFVEYFTPQLFPVMIGQPWVALSPHLGLAPIAGIPIYSFFSYLIILETLSYRRDRHLNLYPIAITLLFIVLNPILAQRLEPTSEKSYAYVRMVQANISSNMKVQSEQGGYVSSRSVIDRYKELSFAPYNVDARSRPDLIIWPETAYPFPLSGHADNIQDSYLPILFSDLALHHQSDIFFGGYQDAYELRSEYNSNFHVTAQGNLKDVYHKRILIPFGETLPFGSLNQYLAPYIKNISFFARGDKFSLFETTSSHSFINTICYEILKPEYIRNYLNRLDKRPHAIVNLTNDSWYGDTAEPEQHLFLASWRAIEFNLPILRSTNTGITTFIKENGIEQERLGVGKTGNLDIKLELQKFAPTLYQKFGFGVLSLVCFALFLFQRLLLKLKK